MLEAKPCVIWFTGFSGSGKTTIARELTRRLKDQFRARVQHLDGDVVRDMFPQTGFSREERDAHIMRMGFLASLLEQHDVFVIASFISPYDDARQRVRSLCKRMFLVHLSTPLETCEARDPKGLYARVRAGEIENFTGIDDPYEAPVKADLVIDTSQCTIDEAARKILQAAICVPDWVI